MLTVLIVNFMVSGITSAVGLSKVTWKVTLLVFIDVGRTLLMGGGNCFLD